jgi:hypothetical protein
VPSRNQRVELRVTYFFGLRDEPSRYRERKTIHVSRAADGRFVITTTNSNGYQTDLIALDHEGTELSRLRAGETLPGSISLGVDATSVEANRAYFAVLHTLFDGSKEIVAFRLTETGEWQEVTHAPTDTFGESQLVIADGTIFVRDPAPDADNVPAHAAAAIKMSRCRARICAPGPKRRVSAESMNDQPGGPLLAAALTDAFRGAAGSSDWRNRRRSRCRCVQLRFALRPRLRAEAVQRGRQLSERGGLFREFLLRERLPF